MRIVEISKKTVNPQVQKEGVQEPAVETLSPQKRSCGPGWLLAREARGRVACSH